jgi:hypothetical protein
LLSQHQVGLLLQLTYSDYFGKQIIRAEGALDNRLDSSPLTAIFLPTAIDRTDKGENWNCGAESPKKV